MLRPKQAAWSIEVIVIEVGYKLAACSMNTNIPGTSGTWLLVA